jgi:hypothetical protein
MAQAPNAPQAHYKHTVGNYHRYFKTSKSSAVCNQEIVKISKKK